jgi:hypothetical protein
MGKNKHVDLFKDIIPAVDTGTRELWDAVTEEGRKEIKGDLWNLNRYISSVQTENRDLKEYYLRKVNDNYNKNWAAISKHPKLQWLTLCTCSDVLHKPKKTYFHEWIPLKKEKNKKEELLADLFPNMKMSDIETLASITTDKEIKKYLEDSGWDKKDINGIKL